MALSHVAELEAKIAKLQAMAQALRELASNCHGNNRPDCPIIKGLAELANPLQRVGRPMVARMTSSFGMDTPASSRVREATASTK